MYFPAKTSGTFSPLKNFPCKSTNGTKLSFSSLMSIGGISFSRETRASSAPKVAAVCTIPVPSSVVTKSPAITRNAFSGFSAGKNQGTSCS